MKKLLVLTVVFSVFINTSSYAIIGGGNRGGGGRRNSNPPITVNCDDQTQISFTTSKGEKYCVDISGLEASYTNGPAVPEAKVADAVSVFKAAWQTFYSPAKNGQSALAILNAMDNQKTAGGTYAYSVRTIGMNSQSVADAIESSANLKKVKGSKQDSPKTSTQKYVSVMNACLTLTKFSDENAKTCCSLPSLASAYVNLVPGEAELIAAINATANSLQTKCIIVNIGAWKAKWNEAVVAGDAKKIEESLIGLFDINEGFTNLDTSIAGLDLRISRAQYSGKETVSDIDKMKEEKKNIIKNKTSVDEFYDIVKGQFVHPCFDAVISADKAEKSADKNAVLGVLKGKYLDELQMINSLDAIKIIQNVSYFDKTLSGDLDTNQEACVLFWVVTAFKNSPDISDETKLNDVAKAIVNKFGYDIEEGKSLFASMLVAAIKNNDPNTPRVFFEVLEGVLTGADVSIDLDMVDYTVIKNEIAKMKTLKPVLYTDLSSFSLALLTQPNYLATSADASSLVALLSSLNNDEVFIGTIVDKLKERYEATTNFDRSSLIKAIVSLIKKDADAAKNFIDLFKKSFKNINIDITSADVITPTNINNPPVNPVVNPVVNPIVTPVDGDISTELKTAIAKVLDIKNDKTAFTKNFDAALSLITKDLSMDKFQTAIKEELKKTIKAYDEKFWITENDASLNSLADIAFFATIKKFDTMLTDLVAAITAAPAETPVLQIVKDRLSATKVTTVDGKSITDYSSEELKVLAKARLLFTAGKKAQEELSTTITNQNPKKTKPFTKLKKREKGVSSYKKLVKKGTTTSKSTVSTSASTSSTKSKSSKKTTRSKMSRINRV